MPRHRVQRAGPSIAQQPPTCRAGHAAVAVRLAAADIPQAVVVHLQAASSGGVGMSTLSTLLRGPRGQHNTLPALENGPAIACALPMAQQPVMCRHSGEACAAGGGLAARLRAQRNPLRRCQAAGAAADV